MGLFFAGAYSEDGQEGFLGDVYAAYPLHALLAFLLLFEELALAGDVAAIAFGEDVFAHGGDVFAGDHAAADGGLERDFEHLAGNQFSQAADEFAAALDASDAGKYQAFAVGWSGPVDPDGNISNFQLSQGSQNVSRASDKAIDDMIIQARTSNDVNQRKQLYGQFQDIMSVEVPSPVILFNTGIYGVNKRVQGTDFGPFNQFANRPWNYKTWVTDGK